MAMTFHDESSLNGQEEDLSERERKKNNHDKTNNMGESKAARILKGTNLPKWIYILFWVQVLTHIVQPDLDSCFPLKQNRILSFFLPEAVDNKVQPVESDVMTLCCPGGGFAGFWFTLGRLFSLEKRASIDLLVSANGGKGLEDKRRNLTLFGEEEGKDISELDISHSRNSNKPIHYYCYSAGCIGVVSILKNYSVNQVFDMALTTRERWKKGYISRYQVVEDFIDQMLDPEDGSSDDDIHKHAGTTRMTNSMLSRIHVVTTKLNLQSLNIFEPVSTSPGSVSELKTLLLQTSFIPFVTGDGFWYSTNSSQEKYIDGAFSSYQHDTCHALLDIPNDPKLLWNTLNMNLLREDAELFWQMGLEFDTPNSQDI